MQDSFSEKMLKWRVEKQLIGASFDTKKEKDFADGCFVWKNLRNILRWFKQQNFSRLAEKKMGKWKNFFLPKYFNVYF